MAQPPEQDLNPSFDPTGYTEISGAQLMQLASGLSPVEGVGLVITTEDVLTTPQVPDVTGTEKWAFYLWRRLQTSTATIYVWNPAAASDATFLKWQAITEASIPDGSITNSKLAAGAVTSDKVTSIAYTQITGTPSGLPPSGAAGGDLTGSYPNPTVDALKITSAKLAADAVTTTKILDSNVTLAKLSLNSGTAFQMMRINAGATAWEMVTKLITQLAEPVVGDASKLIRVNSGGTGFEIGVTFTSGFNTARDAQTFTSTPTTIPSSAGTFVNQAHGLGSTPKVVEAVMVCASAELGYAVGDEIPLFCGIVTGGPSRTFAVMVNATNVAVVYNNTAIALINTAGTSTNITNANWQVKVTCRL